MGGGLGNPVGTGTAFPGGTNTTHDYIAFEEAQYRRKTFRQWWGMKNHQLLWILAGAPTLSLEAPTRQNVWDDAVNMTKDVFEMFPSTSNFDVLAFAPCGAKPKDATSIETHLAIMHKSVVLLLSKCLPHNPAERQRRSDRIGTLHTTFKSGLNRLCYAASCCTRALASPVVVVVICIHINRDVGD